MDDPLFRTVSPSATRWVALGVLTVSGFCVFVSGVLVLRGDERGLLISILGILSIWVSVLIDRDARRGQERDEASSAKPSGVRMPVWLTRATGLTVLALGGFSLVASLAHYFGDEPSAWLGLFSVPFSILLIWLGLTIDRDRLQGERRRQREREGDPRPDDPEP